MKFDVKNPNFIRWALAIVVVGAAVPTYFLTSQYPFTWAARSQNIKQLEERHEKLSAELERARLLVRNLERVEQEYAILHDQWKVAATLLPDENEMPDLLRKVTAAGQQSGVDFEIFKPQTVVNQGFYSDNPVEVRINGGYHQTGVFMSRLANLNRIVNVSKLKMVGIDNQKDATATVRTDMLLTAYTQGPANAPAPGDVSATKTLQAKADAPKDAQPTANAASTAKAALTGSKAAAIANQGGR